MLSVARDAPADEIKKAFRREIARYHPDKVQHLGREFQEMASGIAADLTEAYRILMDPELRARYDEDLGGGGAASAPSAASRQAPGPDTRPAAAAAPVSEPAPPPPRVRQDASAGIDFVRKASLSRLRDAIDDVLGGAEPLAVPGFDIAV